MILRNCANTSPRKRSQEKNAAKDQRCNCLTYKHFYLYGLSCTLSSSFSKLNSFIGCAPLATMTRSSGTVVFRFNPQKREPPRRNGLGCHKTERPGLTAPCMIVVCRICHASPARGVFQTADGFGCIAPQHRCPWRAGAYRRDSPSSLWEGVSKFHYPPRCPRARFASTGTKATF